MKGLLTVVGVLALLAALVIGLGYSQGWFQVAPAGTDGNSGPTINVNKDKIKSDTDAAKEKVKDLQDKAKDKVKDLQDKAKDKTDAPSSKDKEEPQKP